MGSPNVYSTVLIDHYRRPVNKGRLADETINETGYNPKCGDVIRLSIRMDDHKIEEVMFDGKGCMICLASASILTAQIRNITTTDARLLVREIENMFRSGKAGSMSTLHDEIKALSSVRQYPTRSQCVTLAWQTLDQALEKAGE